MPIFYSTLLLTAVNLLLRFTGTAFQVWISGRIGAEGVGLLQLVLSVGAFAMVAGTAGIRTAAMYLTAEESPRKAGGVLSGCFLYSILCSGFTAGLLFLTAPVLAKNWIGTPEAQDALRLMAGFLPCMCLCGTLSGYFTARNRIGALAAVEVLEQLVSISVTLALLKLWAGQTLSKIFLAVTGGSCAGALTTLICLLILRLREKADAVCPSARRVAETALPLAAGDLLRSGISTTENLMVPRRLAHAPGVDRPLAQFGMLGGMVFPILMFPASILYSLGELLIPELARCHAAGSRVRIRYLVGKSLRITFLYGIFSCTLLWLLAEPLCLRFYGSAQAGRMLRCFAPLIPMLYCDAIVDAMTKGLGQQRLCVRYNILTGALDVVFLFFLLPIFGINGYFFSFLVTHLLNFLLSIRRLLKITGLSISLSRPILASAAMLISLGGSGLLPFWLQVPGCLAMLGSLLTLAGILGSEDLRWLRGLIQKRRPAEAGRPKKAD